MALTVRESGLHSIVVDGGRPAFRHLGMPLGGAADRAAYELGNALLGNESTAPALEITMAGPTLHADQRTACVLFGSPFLAAIANKGRLPSGTTFTLEAGDVLKIGGTPTGVRAYLCVAGGFDVPHIMNSASGLSPIAVGDSLPCAESSIGGRALPFAVSPVSSSVDSANATIIRVLPGPQADWFLHAERFFEANYEVLSASNRMGLRLRGVTLERRPGELISEAVAPGSVQIANDGQPIVLGVDGQTIGGYPKIAHAIRADLDALAQLRPGTFVRFVAVTTDEVAKANTAREAVLREWFLRLRVAPGL